MGDPTAVKEDEDPDLLSDSDGGDQPGRDVVVMFAVFFELGLAPISLLIGWWLGHTPLERFIFRWQDAALGVVLTAPLILLCLAMLRWPIGPLRKIRDFFDDEFVPLLAGGTWSDIALIAVSAGVGEEMLFRGVIQSTLSGLLGDAWALAIASLLFGLLHPISVPYVVVSTLLGAFLGATFWLNGNLLTAMVTHGLYDFVLMTYLLKYRTPRGPIVSPIPPIDDHAEIDDFDES